jgi:hypothetical protein
MTCREALGTPYAASAALARFLLRGMIGRGRFAASQNEEAPKDGGHSGASSGPFGGTDDGEGLPITASEITLRRIESIYRWCSAKLLADITRRSSQEARRRPKGFLIEGCVPTKALAFSPLLRSGFE